MSKRHIRRFHTPIKWCFIGGSWQRSHHEVVSMVTVAWDVCQTASGTLATGQVKLILRGRPPHTTRWSDPRPGPPHLIICVGLLIPAAAQMRATKLTNSDGVDLATSCQAGPEPESPLARARGSIRAALSGSASSADLGGQKQQLVRGPVLFLGPVQAHHS